MTAATAPAKIILFGEHAVVYGRPAIAAPVSQLLARAEVRPGSRKGLRLLAADIGLDLSLQEAGADEPLAMAARLTLAELRLEAPPDLEVQITSAIPIAAGLGSGAAVSVALIRALSRHLGTELPPDLQSALAYKVDEIHHGTPSGIDNTVIATGKLVYYVKDETLETFPVGQPLSILIGDSGIASPTARAVAGVRERWRADPGGYESVFDEIGQLTKEARACLETGKPARLGELMDQNHRLLAQLGVSHASLDRFAEIARRAGAQGAKLSGAGLGGNIIALAAPSTIPHVEQALLEAGARQVFRTEIGR